MNAHRTKHAIKSKTKPSTCHNHYPSQQKTADSGKTKNFLKKGLNKSQEDETNYNRTCFIGGLHIRLKESDLIDYMREHFPLISISKIHLLPSKIDPKANRGFGFVTLKTEADYRSVVGTEISINGKRINFRPAKKLKKPEIKRRVAIKYLSKKAQDKDLEKVFKSKGWQIKRCYIIVDSLTLASKGLAFVDMKSEQDFEACLAYKGELLCCGKPFVVERYEERQKKASTEFSSNSKTLKNVKGSLKPKGREGCNNPGNLPQKPEIDFKKSPSPSSRWKFLKPSRKRRLNYLMRNLRLNRISRFSLL